MNADNQLMAKIITETEQEDLWEAAVQLGHVTCRMDEFEEVLEWKSPYSQHYERNIWFRPGLSLDIYDSKHQQEIGYKGYHPEPFPLTLTFNLTGTLGELICGILDDFYYVRAGQNSLLSVAGTKEIEKYPVGRQQVLCIRLTPDILKMLSQGQEDSLPTQLKRLLEHDSPPLLYQLVGKMTNSIIPLRHLVHP